MEKANLDGLYHGSSLVRVKASSAAVSVWVKTEATQE
jgi:hypothetical protein